MTDTLDARMPRRRERHPLPAPQKSPCSPESQPASDARVAWERVGADCYAVLSQGDLVGFVDVAGNVYVALAGRRYDRAVEVGQSIVFERAVDAVVAAVAHDSAA